MEVIITAVACVAVIGVICAAILSLASKAMAVKTDARAAEIENCLPGSNCGACGFPGCAGYAAALVSGEGAKANLCTPGGNTAAKLIAEILGIESEEAAGKFAVVRCGGGERQKKMDYRGIQTCAAAKQVFGGENACAFGCIGYGDCQKSCPSDAVCMINGLAWINPDLCTGCGLCVKSCPNRLIAVTDSTDCAAVLCANIEKGAAKRKKCANPCLGCGRCVRECPSGAAVMEDNLARIDSEKCTACGHCAEICVTKCIKLLQTAEN
ncbi:MAG: RnfABCDGE type electron transport complex subunit B [Oscillospiraceae bacterium]|nr:RnfABCDGE type electron transport complex subunit B [Oscillospiraceae bacterium]